MATDGSTESFQGRGSFFVLGDLKKNFFFQNVQHKIQFQNIYFFFSLRGVAPKNGPKLKKVGLKTGKTTLKLE